jgi:hypothetical protein
MTNEQGEKDSDSTKGELPVGNNEAGNGKVISPPSGRAGTSIEDEKSDDSSDEDVTKGIDDQPKNESDSKAVETKNDSDLPDVKKKFEDAANQIFNAAAAIAQQTQYDWIEVMPQTLSRVSALYCKPNSSFLITSPCPRIILITGREKTGRGFSAHGVALDIKQSTASKNTRIYSLKVKDSFLNKSLLQILAFDDDLKKDSVLVIDDLPNLVSNSKDFSIDNLLHIEAGLERAGSYAVICVNGGEDLTTIPSHHAIQSLSIGYESDEDKFTRFEEILNKHLEFDAEYGNSTQLLTTIENRLLKLNASKFVHHFYSIPQIEHCLRAISIRDRSKDPVDGPAVPSEQSDGDFQENRGGSGEILQKLLSIASQIGRLSKSLAKSWFEQLNLNEKIFAMLVILLRGMPSHYVQKIYQELTRKLLDEKLPLQDHRTQGIFDMQSRLQVETRIGNSSYEFVNDLFRNEIENQIKNYSDLLAAVIPVAANTDFGYELDACAALGKVIARLKQDDWPELKIILRDMIASMGPGLKPSQKELYLRMISFAIGELYRNAESKTVDQRPFRDVIVEEMDRWLDHGRGGNEPSKDYRYAFVVMISIGECFTGLASSTFGEVPMDCTDYTKLRDLLNRAVRWYFPWVFFEDLAKTTQFIIDDLFLPYGECFRYTLDRLMENLPKHYVEFLTSYNRFDHHDEMLEDQIAEDENVVLTREVPNFYPLGEEFEKVYLERFIRMKGLNTWIAYEQKRVFDDPSFDWVLDLAATILSTEPIDYDLEPPTLELGISILEIENETTEEDYKRAVQATVNWFDQCDNPKSRIRCESWFSDIVHRCSFPQRRKLAKYMKQHSLEVSQQTRAYCDSLLMRMQVLDGQPIDTSDQTFGVLLVHGHAAELHRLRSFGKCVQNQVGYLCPLKIGYLGDTRLLDSRVDSEKQKIFEGVQSRPPLLMPILEGVDLLNLSHATVLCGSGKASSASATDPPIMDIDEITSLAQSDQSKILIVANRTSSQTTPKAADQEKTFRFYQIPFEKKVSKTDGTALLETSVQALRQIEYEISKRVRADLIHRSPERLASDLSINLSGNLSADISTLVKALEQVFIDFESTGELSSLTSKYRQFSGLVQLLSMLDIEECCVQVKKMISEQSESVVHELGKGASLFLVRLVKWARSEKLSDGLTVLRLWRVLWENVDSCEQEAAEILSLALWLTGSSYESDVQARYEFEAEVDEMLAAIPSRWRRSFLGLIAQSEKGENTRLENIREKLSNQNDKSNIKESKHLEKAKMVSGERIRRAQSFRTEILLGRRRETSILSEREYFCILFDTCNKNLTSRQELCIDYYEILRKNLKPRGVVPIIFLIGLTEPVCVGGACKRELLGHASLTPRPNLVLPILDLFSDEQLQAVVILGRNLPYDIDGLSTDMAARCVSVAESNVPRFVSGIHCMGGVYDKPNSKARGQFLYENTVFIDR